MSHSFDALPSLAQTIETYNLAPKKALGQNFLLDLNLTSKIARSAGPLAGENILEIGPGPGGLTRAILKENPRKLTVVERDERCLPALEEISAAYPEKLCVHSGDALEYVPTLDDTYPTRIISNLPYNVGTALLLNWLEADPWPPFYASMTLMFQKEVAQRIVAEPPSKSYGRLSILAQWRCHADMLFDVPATAFTPPPKVTSTIVHLVPRKEPAPCNLKTLSQVTAAAFGQRRKMLRQSLKSLGVGADLFDMTGIEPTERAERVSVEGFVALANALDVLRAD